MIITLFIAYSSDLQFTFQLLVDIQTTLETVYDLLEQVKNIFGAAQDQKTSPGSLQPSCPSSSRRQNDPTRHCLMEVHTWHLLLEEEAKARVSQGKMVKRKLGLGFLSRELLLQLSGSRLLVARSNDNNTSHIMLFIPSF